MNHRVRPPALRPGAGPASHAGSRPERRTHRTLPAAGAWPRRALACGLALAALALPVPPGPSAELGPPTMLRRPPPAAPVWLADASVAPSQRDRPAVPAPAIAADAADAIPASDAPAPRGISERADRPHSPAEAARTLPPGVPAPEPLRREALPPGGQRFPPLEPGAAGPTRTGPGAGRFQPPARPSALDARLPAAAVAPPALPASPWSLCPDAQGVVALRFAAAAGENLELRVRDAEGDTLATLRAGGPERWRQAGVQGCLRLVAGRRDASGAWQEIPLERASTVQDDAALRAGASGRVRIDAGEVFAMQAAMQRLPASPGPPSAAPPPLDSLPSRDTTSSARPVPVPRDAPPPARDGGDSGQADMASPAPDDASAAPPGDTPAVESPPPAAAPGADVPRAASPGPSAAPSPETSLPDFPWPPPRPSASMKLPRALVTGGHARPTLGQVADRLEDALGRLDYAELSYHAVPDGFAVATRLEQIDADGRPLPAPGRWRAEVAAVSLRGFDLDRYLRALFGAERGHFRVIVFVFTPHAFRPDAARVSQAEAMAWVDEGANKLPARLRARPYGEDFDATALIYEFETEGPGRAARFNKPGLLSGRAHLERAFILPLLRGEP